MILICVSSLSVRYGRCFMVSTKEEFSIMSEKESDQDSRGDA